MFQKILIANRGEIALRIVRTCRELGIRSVVAHSKADAATLAVRLADESICVGPDAPRLSYLNIPAIISAAAVTDSEAIHPGYGFLAENPAFAEVCRACSVTFIGPSPEAIRLMGDKAQARQLAKQTGVPVVPGSELPLKDAEEALAVADAIGYPVIFKAAAGGGGRGMRIVRARAEAGAAFDACQSEAGAAFGSSEVYCEKFVENARHIEVQVLGDRNGIRVHLGERDCSVQRRHQKLIEESPAPALSAEMRAGLHRAALSVAAAVNYASAGTVEFLVDPGGHFYFIEMNTRIQVEHPVTEMVTGIDLIREQIRIAAGEGLGYRQDAVRFDGHAIEVRVNAEDPETFAPSAGRVTAWIPPGGFGVRVDSHLAAPCVVPPFYDSLLAKIIVHGRDRREAIERMRRALAETVVEGVKTSIPFQLRVLGDPLFLEGRFTSVDTARLLG
ncbi:MAG: acetyl-CoA carboxylase biotin carboxylase subunit [Candidatus Rokubacteria bacterium RIFCSPHIGHO2_12_FULL_73_22]|nr:MAG: acetyl-CoA carboxylase biotin carboxylase subunit [Candidatus Rokubacteria bacterium RIFCSPHIGHO2_12_FULL_73_22]OGL02773.1 MAG: acetyl-CoA carboxylase biotin carboxylase subunit [Candidatus Rokubacteria bacterium RIFCSPHIGHO2_02_FULL_73_26]OGL07739.1 MAG: acetyl-CoA carboxylase biotin carboxylase subunit [Candidatus Rokubacteria bacterium RIFCSPLOWO2_02_FULL_73_56]OGL21635.1 MAG: acetyl-CoA carboxylase biotin carboxylase subunit [Candidatus Rokubacteria bacterium RIFCSPLOWO2_12_FULL_73_4